MTLEIRSYCYNQKCFKSNQLEHASPDGSMMTVFVINVFLANQTSRFEDIFSNEMLYIFVWMVLVSLQLMIDQVFAKYNEEEYCYCYKSPGK